MKFISKYQDALLFTSFFIAMMGSRYQIDALFYGGGFLAGLFVCFVDREG